MMIYNSNIFLNCLLNKLTKKEEIACPNSKDTYVKFKSLLTIFGFRISKKTNNNGYQNPSLLSNYDKWVIMSQEIPKIKRTQAYIFTVVGYTIFTF